MIIMNDSKIRRMISDSRNREYNFSRNIEDYFPDSKGIHIWYKIEHTNFAGHIENEKEYNILPGSKLCVQVSCPNRDCTQGFFSLTSEANMCLRDNVVKEGTVMCEGKEDFKYYNHVGFTCQTRLRYKLTPIK